MKSKFVPITKDFLTKLTLWLCFLIGPVSLSHGQIIHLPSFTVQLDCDLTLSITSFVQTCDGAEVCVHMEGGTPPYNIRFLSDNTNPSPTEDLDVCFQHLEPGNYTLEVKDDEGCSKELSIEIPAVDYYIPADVQNVSCYGAMDGAINLEIEIDLAPLYFQWEGPNGFTADTEDIEGLAPGIYDVSISTTDDICVGLGSWVIEEPAPLEIEVRLTEPACGPPDGCVYVSGGTTPYYIWVFDHLPDLYAENPYGSITDWNDLDPAAGVPYDPSTTEGPAFCAEDVANGVYYIFVVDLHFCYHWERIVIEAFPDFQREVEVNAGSCTTAEGGSICFKIDGAGGPFATTIYPSITDEAIIGNEGCFDHLAPGIYELRTVDANGCALVEKFEVAPEGGVEAKFEFTNTNCNDVVGGCLYVRGGEQPYRIFAWYWPTPPFAEPQITIADNGEPLADGGPANRNIPFGPVTSPTDYRRCVDQLVPGYYVMVVIDVNGCWDVIRMQTPAGTALDLRTQVQDARCYGQADGAIELEIQGGMPPYAIGLSPNEYQIVDDNYIRFDELLAGRYTIKVEDRQGCSAWTEVTIGQPGPIEAKFEITSPSCTAQVDGCLTVHGGTYPYRIWVWEWNSVADVEPQVVFDADGNPVVDGAVPTDRMDFGPNTANVFRRCAEDIPPGLYLILVVDENRCYTWVRVHIPAAGGLDLRTEVEPVSCQNQDDGRIFLKIEGGVPPYTLVLWDGVSQLLDGDEVSFEGLSAGTYPITVTDEQGCTRTIEPVVPGGEGLTTELDFDPYGSYACLDILNGTAPFAYHWYDLATNTLIGTEDCVAELSPGTYWVEAKDAAGCSSTDLFFIDEPICAGGRAIVNPRAIRSGASTTFYLEAYYGDAIQWQFRTRNMDWLSIPGANSATYDTPPLYAGSDRIIQVRAQVICANGEVEYSSIAEFKIYGHVFLTQLPVGLLQDRRLFDPARQVAARAMLSSVSEPLEVQVFPTVSATVVNLRFPRQLEQVARLQLRNSMGHLIRSDQVIDQVFALSLHDLPAGVYIIQLEYNGKLETHRVIVP